MPLTTYTAGEVLTAASLNANFTFAAGSSGVVQVKNAFKNDAFVTASTTYVDVTGLSVSITPTSATNKILVVHTTNIGTNNSASAEIVLVRDSTLIAVAATVNQTHSIYATTVGNQSMQSTAMMFLDSPATTAATTYKVQLKAGAASNVFVNRDFNNSQFGVSTITVFEVTP